MNSKYLGIMLAALGATFFGISAACSSLLFNHIAVAPEWLVSVRMFFTGIILLGYLSIKRQPIFSIWRNKRDVILLILFAIFGVYISQTAFIFSVYYGNAAVGTILQALAPAIIVLALLAFKRVLPRVSEVIAIIISLAGVFLLITNGNLAKLVVPKAAIYWGLISTLGTVAYTLIPRGLLQRYSPLPIVGWGMLIGGIFSNFQHPVWKMPAHFDVQAAAYVVAIVIIGTLLSYVCYLMSLNYLSPAMVSMLGTFEPLTATILAVILLNVGFQFWQAIGTILALGAVIIINLPAEIKWRAWFVK
ncbi:DMT family transporter [Periweissella ghanensis]|uniref:Inner membrane transporter YicL n=1 Tax=Periweissella ghanensis TaxID=467997 RepID=A0ABM8ZBN9_9LACO|nr:DMT family transporter [Periweissella ghanensis]MCM0600006.1 EamA family transporter [Periweissella ghanensis]CAH0418938.1 putative inner membrane transporter YicL [Periweissella ghanensis]